MGGCDFNAYRNGVKTHFGSGSDFDVDSSKPFTVVTQFITTDGTDSGDLSEIKRFYVQDGKKIPNAKTSVAGLDPFDSITDGNCDAQKQAFGESNDFKSHGGMKAMSDSLERGMVLVMSIWDDAAANMLWLDSVYPANATGAGAERGPCSPDSGAPADVEKSAPDAFVQFSNIKFGEIGSTGGSPAPGPSPSPSPSPSAGCCTWDGKYCGDTTEYCAGNEQQCKECKGDWCTDCLPPFTTTTGPSPAPTPPAPTPAPSDCPGGSLSACIDLCPADVFAECVQSCKRRCPSILV
jgi:cellulose 1,4-beta-cellobiosidase